MDFEKIVELVKEKIRDKVIAELLNHKVPDEMISMKIDEIVNTINDWVEGNITDFDFYKRLSGTFLKLPLASPVELAESIVTWSKDLVNPLQETKTQTSVLEEVIRRVIVELKNKGEI